jgi:hypothetical protein
MLVSFLFHKRTLKNYRIQQFWYYLISLSLPPPPPTHTHTQDIVIVPAGIIEENKGKLRPYTEHLRKKANAEPIPPAPRCKFASNQSTFEMHC